MTDENNDPNETGEIISLGVMSYFRRRMRRSHSNLSYAEYNLLKAGFHIPYIKHEPSETCRVRRCLHIFANQLQRLHHIIMSSPGIDTIMFQCQSKDFRIPNAVTRKTAPGRRRRWSVTDKKLPVNLRYLKALLRFENQVIQSF